MSSLPAADEMEAIAEGYRNLRDWDRIHAPSAEARKDLSKIEAAARALLEALQTCGARARDALDRQVSMTIDGETGGQIVRALMDGTTLRTGLEAVRRERPESALEDGAELDNYNAPGRARRQELVRLTAMVIAAAKSARAGIPISGGRNDAARFAAVQLRERFVHRGLAFTASADELGGASGAVLALIKIARMAGHAMTVNAARRYVQLANAISKRENLTAK